MNKFNLYFTYLIWKLPLQSLLIIHNIIFNSLAQPTLLRIRFWLISYVLNVAFSKRVCDISFFFFTYIRRNVYGRVSTRTSTTYDETERYLMEGKEWSRRRVMEGEKRFEVEMLFGDELLSSGSILGVLEHEQRKSFSFLVFVFLYI